MISHFDTIVAPITPPGAGAIAAIRLSGPEAWLIGRAAFPTLPLEPTPRYALIGTFACGDEGLALPFVHGRSFTGEQTLELYLHGSTAAVQLTIDSCLAAGARHAEPGEFTLRAFLNGRFDLTQAEAIAETVAAESEAALNAANLQRNGTLNRAVGSILQILEGVTVVLEASIDFSEEIGPLPIVELRKQLWDAREAIGAIISTAPHAGVLRQGFRIALVGRPNAGKSTLFNRLIGSPQAIVTAVPGTTRDVLLASVLLNGFTFVLQDTAGLRVTNDEVEQIGVARSRQAAMEATLTIYLYDAVAGFQPDDQLELDRLDGPHVVVATKIDLSGAQARGQDLAISATTGAGMSELIDSLSNSTRNFPALPYLVNTRHLFLLDAAQEALSASLAAFDSSEPADLVLAGLTDALRALRSITGEAASEDMINQIFSRFCIGK